jgi:hypothetical protein
MNRDITEERAARRFHQMAVLERQLQLKAKAMLETQAVLKALKEDFEGLLARLRTAARDEGELSLFDLDGE